jgi:hypothetical protein
MLAELHNGDKYILESLPMRVYYGSVILGTVLHPARNRFFFSSSQGFA